MYIKVRDYKRLVTEIRTFLEGYEATESLNRLGFIPSGEVNSLFISPLDALAILFDDYGEEDLAIPIILTLAPLVILYFIIK